MPRRRWSRTVNAPFSTRRKTRTNGRFGPGRSVNKETRTMGGTTRAMIHADLSEGHPGEEYHLWANGQRYPIQPHTDETRAQARAAAPHLGAMPDEMLTHFAHAVELPSHCALRIHLLHTTKSFDDAATEHAPGNVAIYVPPARPGTAVHVPIDYASTAKALLFHHPDLVTHDPEVARIIYEHIDCPEISKMILEIIVPLMRRKGRPRPAHGWAHLVPFTPPANPDPRVKMDGKATRYEVHPIPEV